jgi:hypothetical protein
MADVKITLGRAGGNSLKPKEDQHTKGDITSVPDGSTVTFDVEPGLNGTTIDFQNGTPFNTPSVGYNASHNLRESLFVPGKRTAFRYRCHAKGPNGEPLEGEGGGGEIEIIKN